MQALAANVKAEVRAALAHHGISKFVIKPVQRQYAFELATIPRRKQWVLKVKYAATAPQLPLGLTGLSLRTFRELYANSMHCRQQKRFPLDLSYTPLGALGEGLKAVGQS